MSQKHTRSWLRKRNLEKEKAAKKIQGAIRRRHENLRRETNRTAREESVSAKDTRLSLGGDNVGGADQGVSFAFWLSFCFVRLGELFHRAGCFFFFLSACSCQYRGLASLAFLKRERKSAPAVVLNFVSKNCSPERTGCFRNILSLNRQIVFLRLVVVYRAGRCDHEVTNKRAEAKRRCSTKSRNAAPSREGDAWSMIKRRKPSIS